MKIDLTEIAHSIGMLYTYEVDDAEVDLESTGIALCSPVRGKLNFSNAGPLLLARGKLTACVELECVRCLQRFPTDTTINVEEQFPIHPELPPDAVANLKEDEMEPGDLDQADALFAEGILDLSEMIRQNLLVELPFAPLCQIDCQGLCPSCGKNWNEGRCDCVSQEEEWRQQTHPLAGLKDALQPEAEEDRA